MQDSPIERLRANVSGAVARGDAAAIRGISQIAVDYQARRIRRLSGCTLADCSFEAMQQALRGAPLDLIRAEQVARSRLYVEAHAAGLRRMAFDPIPRLNRNRAKRGLSPVRGYAPPPHYSAPYRLESA